jgi:hypothetical protein
MPRACPVGTSRSQLQTKPVQFFPDATGLVPSVPHARSYKTKLIQFFPDATGLPHADGSVRSAIEYGFAQKVFWVRLCRTLAVSLRLTVRPT